MDYADEMHYQAKPSQAKPSQANSSNAILEKAMSFSHIILRGASHIGQQMLDYLLSEGVAQKKITFWDKKANSIQNISGVPVLLPFSGSFPLQDTLILHCIKTLHYDGEDYVKHGYTEHMNALTLLCPYCGMGSGKRMLICQPGPFCARIRCPRQIGREFCYVPYRADTGTSKETLVADKLDFGINTLCTLKCRHCIQYINHYPPEKRLNFPLARILADMECVCATHDFIRIACILGGEPFLHPDFSHILAHLLAQPNVGMVQVASNGICRISEKNMAVLQNERVLLRISHYAGALDEKQKALLARNLRHLAERGIIHEFYHPTWQIAPILQKRDCSIAELEDIKTGCTKSIDCHSVFNGVYSACDMISTIALHGVADYIEDKVLLPGETENLSREALRDRIIAHHKRPYYQSCAHCDFSDKFVLPGEQGIDSRYAHIGKRDSTMVFSKKEDMNVQAQ
ncbi:MAG: radical SAM protein [Azoarcus sp.]|jgi:hypothetical protein|nr:radical SAM protein [Azoarcus sp.]